MKAFLWRIIIAVLFVFIFFLVMPLFFQVIGLSLAGPAWQLIKICIGLIALVYVIFGPEPPMPF